MDENCTICGGLLLHVVCTARIRLADSRQLAGQMHKLVKHVYLQLCPRFMFTLSLKAFHSTPLHFLVSVSNDTHVASGYFSASL